MSTPTQPDTASDPIAVAAYQDFLDQSDAALEDGDFDAFISRVILPHKIIQRSEELTVSSIEEMREVYRAIRQMLSTRNIAQRTRLCTDARVCDDGTLTGHHTTWLVTIDNTIEESYRVENHLRQRGGVWCIASSKFTGSLDALPSRVHRIHAAAQSGVLTCKPTGKVRRD